MLVCEKIQFVKNRNRVINKVFFMDSYLKLFLDSQSLIINQSYPHVDNSSLLPYSCNSLDVLYFLEVFADVLYIIHIVYVGPECTLENAVVTTPVIFLQAFSKIDSSNSNCIL